MDITVTDPMVAGRPIAGGNRELTARPALLVSDPLHQSFR
jgi:hypothetical protein